MYRMILTSTWFDKKVKALKSDGKLAFVYLLTNDHTHVGGIYHLARQTMTAELGMTRRRLDRVCDTLSGVGLVKFDDENDLVWVVNMAKYQARGEKMARAIEAHLPTLHNSWLIREFCKKYKRIRYTPSDTLSDTSSEVGAQEQYQEQYQEQKGTTLPADKPPVGCVPRKPKRPRHEYAPDFLTFFAAYPKNVGKLTAFKAWQKADLPPLDNLLAAIERQKHSDRWHRGFIKDASTWLNQECWNDELPERGAVGAVSGENLSRVPSPPGKYDGIAKVHKYDAAALAAARAPGPEDAADKTAVVPGQSPDAG